MKTEEKIMQVYGVVAKLESAAIAAVVLDAVSGNESDFDSDLAGRFKEFAEQNPSAPSVMFGVMIANAVIGYLMHQFANAEKIQ